MNQYDGFEVQEEDSKTPNSKYVNIIDEKYEQMIGITQNERKNEVDRELSKSIIGKTLLLMFPALFALIVMVILIFFTPLINIAYAIISCDVALYLYGLLLVVGLSIAERFICVDDIKRSTAVMLILDMLFAFMLAGYMIIFEDTSFLYGIFIFGIIIMFSCPVVGVLVLYVFNDIKEWIIFISMIISEIVISGMVAMYFDISVHILYLFLVIAAAVVTFDIKKILRAGYGYSEYILALNGAYILLLDIVKWCSIIWPIKSLFSKKWKREQERREYQKFLSLKK